MDYQRRIKPKTVEDVTDILWVTQDEYDTIRAMFKAQVDLDHPGTYDLDSDTDRETGNKRQFEVTITDMTHHRAATYKLMVGDGTGPV